MNGEGESWVQWLVDVAFCHAKQVKTAHSNSNKPQWPAWCCFQLSACLCEESLNPFQCPVDVHDVCRGAFSPLLWLRWLLSRTWRAPAKTTRLSAAIPSLNMIKARLCVKRNRNGSTNSLFTCVSCFIYFIVSINSLSTAFCALLLWHETKGKRKDENKAKQKWRRKRDPKSHFIYCCCLVVRSFALPSDSSSPKPQRCFSPSPRERASGERLKNMWKKPLRVRARPNLLWMCQCCCHALWHFYCCFPHV